MEIDLLEDTNEYDPDYLPKNIGNRSKFRYWLATFSRSITYNLPENLFGSDPYEIGFALTIFLFNIYQWNCGVLK
jgi:hypothetical protein